MGKLWYQEKLFIYRGSQEQRFIAAKSDSPQSLALIKPGLKAVSLSGLFLGI